MNIRFVTLLMEKTSFPEEAKVYFTTHMTRLCEQGREAAFDALVNLYFESDFSLSAMNEAIDAAAPDFGLSAYTIWMLVLMEAAQRVYQPYLASDMAEEVFWDTFSDLRCKVMECREIHGVWGTFVAHWYPRFYKKDIVKLGRLEFENHPFPGEAPVPIAGITIRPGDPAKSIHIPSSGEPFDAAARMDAYKRAYAYFADELKGRPLICFCHSWLLYPAYRQILPETSNIRSFMEDFHILGAQTEETFRDAWRVFGKNYRNAPKDLPEDTTLRRIFKAHLTSGGAVGAGLGVLVFDGAKLL